MSVTRIVNDRRRDATVTIETRGDNPRIAAMRVQLKLAALSYDGTRYGGPSSDLARAGFAMLSAAAVKYTQALLDREIELPSGISWNPPAQSAALQLAAIAYAGTRHGTDAHIEFTRAGLAQLCGAAVQFTEAIAGQPIRATDPTLPLDPTP